MEKELNTFEKIEIEYQLMKAAIDGMKQRIEWDYMDYDYEDHTYNDSQDEYTKLKYEYAMNYMQDIIKLFR